MKRERRTEAFYIKLTPAERKAFLNLAAARHTTISELIRQLLHGEIGKQAAA